jgi:hypothetical protein
MRLVVTLSAVMAFVVLASAVQAQQQPRRSYNRDRTERITLIDENGRVTTRIRVQPRSYLDGGTEVVPGERKFTDYALPPTYRAAAPTSSWDPNGIHRSPLPMPGSLPGYNPYLPY